MSNDIQSTAWSRWEALDALRGLSVLGMLFNLSPGAWEHRFRWLDHAAWEGWPLIDMVFPTFLFCVGLAMPLSFDSRIRAGATRGQLMGHALKRAGLLVVVGVVVNAYPSFDVSELRIPGILQRIGLCFGIVGCLLLGTSVVTGARLRFRPMVIIAASLAILLLYWLVLAVVPVPGFGAPRFDSVGSWPAVVDRALFGVAHLWPLGTTEGQVTYDPEGVLSTFPACVNVMAGALTAYLIRQKGIRHPALTTFVVGLALMVLAIMLEPLCPIIKKIWTSSFALLSIGVSLIALAPLIALLDRGAPAKWIWPLQVFGANALLAFVICWLLIPIFEAQLLPGGSIRQVGFAAFKALLPNEYASLAFTAVTAGFIWMILWPLYRRRWFIKL